MAVINITGTGPGDNKEVLPAVAGQRIVVQGYALLLSAAATVTWKSATTALSGPMSSAADGGLVCPVCPHPMFWFQTEIGEALNIALSANVVCAGHFVFFYSQR